MSQLIKPHSAKFHYAVAGLEPRTYGSQVQRLIQLAIEVGVEKNWSFPHNEPNVPWFTLKFSLKTHETSLENMGKVLFLVSSSLPRCSVLIKTTLIQIERAFHAKTDKMKV